ncbi:NAD-binding protein [Yinghuangia seranimata]|nr:NAD-binding protein [Yinghuangia seranimata]MDI2132751.1 NAD-binding protein [Yinghuangia seranimata]
MVVCGDDALAYRLTAELARLYEQPVTALVPSAHTGSGLRIAELARSEGLPVTVREAADPSEAALMLAGVQYAEAIALTYSDDQTNIHAALRARRINPSVRLVIRLFNRKLGRYLEDLLARSVAQPGVRGREDATTTVLSDADTAAPALVAAALAGQRSRIVEADGLLLRAADRAVGEPVGPGELCTLALLSDPAASLPDPVGGAAPGPRLLPDDDEASASLAGRGRVVLEAVTRQVAASPPLAPLNRIPRRFPLRELFSWRLMLVVAGLLTLELLFALLTWRVTDDPPLRAAYLSLLDLLSMGDPAIGASKGRQILQLMSGLTGLALLPVLFAVVLQALSSFRTASALRQPPRGLSGHIVLMGLGRVGSRVLDRLHALGVDVVCVERDPKARGVALARTLHVPVVLGDATQDGVLESALIERASAVLALTSSDSSNLETALYAREYRPDIRVVMRLFDDDFAAVVNQAMRASYPQATTRSRSVSTLAAPAFAAAMMGRQILGALPVERNVLVFVALEVGRHADLRGRTVDEVFRPGAWRVLALDVADPDERRPNLGAAANPGRHGEHEPELAWGLHEGYVLQDDDRVVLATTRRGLATLLQTHDGDRTPAAGVVLGTPPADPRGDPQVGPPADPPVGPPAEPPVDLPTGASADGSEPPLPDPSDPSDPDGDRAATG